MARDALENLRKLPPWCYGLLNGQVVNIARGAPEPVASPVDPKRVDALNHRLGVSLAQRLAMEAGITLGWTSEAANPDTHAKALGDSPMPRYTYIINKPVILQVEVAALSEQEAFTMADLLFKAGEGQAIDDGDPYILSQSV